MKPQLILYLLIILSTGIISVTCKPKSDGVRQNYQIDTCVKNIDSSYDRMILLDSLAKKMNFLAKYYKVDHPRGYSVNGANSYNFFIYDLTDTLNNSKSGCIQFMENHVYHFSSLNARFLYSNILVLRDGDMKFFLGINCRNKINRIEEVLEYLTRYLPDNANKFATIQRTKNYKKYGIYFKVDNMSKILCE